MNDESSPEIGYKEAYDKKAAEELIAKSPEMQNIAELLAPGFTSEDDSDADQSREKPQQ